jgi:hypothetical protein
LFPILG